jgi:hypothetical protein
MAGNQTRQIVHKTLSQKYLTQKRAGEVTQVVEHLPSKTEALSSSPNTANKKKREKETYQGLIKLKQQNICIQKTMKH